MLDWLVVGGGIHGVACAASLRSVGVHAKRLKIIDPNPRLLAIWEKSTRSVGMTQLRSTHVHHLHPDPMSLIRFAKTRSGKELGRLRGRYGHPELALFDAHCQSVICEFDLEESLSRSKVFRLKAHKQGWLVSLADGSTCFAKRVVLALGCDRDRPDWLTDTLRANPRIRDGLDCGELDTGSSEGPLLIVGGGMSGVQLALRFLQSEKSSRSLSLVSTAFPKRSLFDSSSGWNGPKYLRAFGQIRSLARRRIMIQEARIPGSVPPDLLSKFRNACRGGAVHFVEGTVKAVVPQADCLEVSIQQGEVQTSAGYSQIVVATGFSRRCPQAHLINQVARDHTLPLAPCGFPVVKRSGEWGRGLFLSGPLAELSCGPVARNIAGARMAADKLRQAAV